ncbi:hypothetical protein ACUSIJ_02735 [Pseudochelatococcus sp. B33]
MNALTELFAARPAAGPPADGAGGTPDPAPAAPAPDRDALGRAASADVRTHELKLLSEAEELIGRAMADGIGPAAYENYLLMRDALSACKSIVRRIS